MTETPTGPDTGFKLFALVKDVLATSQETDTDQLALEVLERIPSYDRDTALFQALRQLVRTSFRPAFIPQPAKNATVGDDVPRQRKAEDPPPKRDGRQWLAKPWEQVREQRPPDEEQVAEFRASLDEADREIAAGNLGTPLAEVMDELDAEDQQKAAGQAPERIARLRQHFDAPTRRPRQGPSPRPSTSPKVAAIREAWRKSLMQRIAVGEGKHKFLGDCTVDDLVFAAEQREAHAKRTADRAGELRRLVDLMREHDASKLSDLPAEVLAEAPLDGAA